MQREDGAIDLDAVAQPPVLRRPPTPLAQSLSAPIPLYALNVLKHRRCGKAGIAWCVCINVDGTRIPRPWTWTSTGARLDHVEGGLVSVERHADPQWY